MKNIFQKRKTQYANEIVMLLAASLERIDKHECSANSVATGISHMLEKRNGRSVVDSLTAGIMTADQLGSHFPKQYWQDSSIANKTACFMSAVDTADELIKNNKLNSNIRKVAKEELEKQTK